MAGTENHRNSGSRRVNMKIWGEVHSFNRNLSRHLSIGTTAIELRVFKKKKKKKKTWTKWENIYGYNIDIWCSFTEIFGILFGFHILSAIKVKIS